MLFSYFTHFYRFYFALFKTRLQAFFYPLPSVVELYLGVPGSMSCAIVKGVSAYCDHLGSVQHVTLSDDDTLAPKVWINDESFGTLGTIAVCRYLGRLTKLHPSTPESALVVDGSLELLHECMQSLGEGTIIHPPTPSDTEEEDATADPESPHQKTVHRVLKLLEERLDTTVDEWMDLNGIALSDVCWFEALRWFDQKKLLPEEQDLYLGHPLVFDWYQMMLATETTPSGKSD